ncbi:hypothetical protein E4U53_006780 [Claviceps sorghi]|nr:hypothetical protein E4U53_006780 [Claviceps sorghi]
MAVTKASTCCAKDGAACACGMSIPRETRKRKGLTRAQPKKQPAPVGNSPPSTATATRPPRKTSSRGRGAHAGPDPPADAPVTAPPRRTPRLPDRPAPVVQDRLASDGGFNPALEIDFTTRK